MQTNPKIKCLLLLSSPKERYQLNDAIKEVCNDLDIKLGTIDEIITPKPTRIAPDLVYEIAKYDLVIVDLSYKTSKVFYELGISRTLDKPTIVLIHEEDNINIPVDLRSVYFIQYRLSESGIKSFKDSLNHLLLNFIKEPRRFRSTLPTTRFPYFPYGIDLDRLEPREFENLCFELISQMGFRKVSWKEDIKEFDIIATLPKKDPDGYEYQELWLVSTGRHFSLKMLDIAINDPEYFFHRIFRFSEGFEELFLKFKIRPDLPITLLLILREEGPPIEVISSRFERQFRKRPFPFSFRVRWWDQSYLTNLVRQYPQIAFKYFSEEGRAKSKYRKSPEELYNENVTLSENLIVTKSQLEEEKKKRFIAERDAAWKDVAFKAAHKLGNPIDAIDTFLQSLKRRIHNNRKDEALQIANEMDTCAEEAKAVIAQFKSLTKSQEISPRLVEIFPLIQHACKTAEENGVKVTIVIMKNCPQVMLDPDRMSECFNELVANAMHWFDKDEKKISVIVRRVLRKDLPEGLDSNIKYLKIIFNDNGCGVPLENKDKIFAPFVTTYTHGTGLGLSLVRWIIEGHGGRIYENGKLGEGASFEIYIPILKKEGV
ncbi:MAG: sensor histidine kinase [Desulfobaccales bacterium]